MITTVTARDVQLPVSLEDAKWHLRVMHGDLDLHIQSLLEAAVEYCETTCGRSLRVSQTLTQGYCSWPCNPVRFDRQPVLATVPGSDPVESAITVAYYADGVLTEVDAANYRLHQSSEASAYLAWDDDFSRPTVDDRDDAVVITYLAGYGTIEAVPSRAKHAIKMLVGHWFNHGEAATIGSAANDVPMATEALLQSLTTGAYR